MNRFKAMVKEACTATKVTDVIVDAPRVAVAPPLVASNVNPTPGTGASSVPPPPAPHAVPRQAARPTSSTVELTTPDGRVIKLDGDFEEISGDTETITRRVWEQDNVSVPKFPTGTDVRRWHNGVA